MREIVLRDYQAASVEALRENIRRGTKAQVLCAPTGSGKCHGVNTPVIMADGTMRMVQDVRVGDRLLGPDGGARTVLSLGSGVEEMFRVTPKKGDPYTCNRSHILSLEVTRVGHGFYLGDGTYVPTTIERVNLSVDTWLSSSATARHCLKGWRPGALEFTDASPARLPLPPYIMGAWLGDGCAKLPAISKPPCRMVDEWCDYARSLGLSVRTDIAISGCPTYHATGTWSSGGRPNPLLNALREAGVLGNKHIPHAYKTASIPERLELLAGLLDSDGHLSGSGYDWISVSKVLAEDFAFLARSLGFACYIKSCKKGVRSTGFVGDYWRCSLSGDTDRIPCRDKKAPPRRQKKRHLVHGIHIEPIGVGQYYGFQLDGDGLYLLGDFTVTHNTEISAYLLEECYRKRKRAVFLVDRESLVRQTSKRLDLYGIPHGVIQAQHWRNRPWEPIQVASVQTIARRGWPDDRAGDEKISLLVIDECHSRHTTATRRLEKRDVVSIGLSATPFSKGLGTVYGGVVCVTTTNRLIADGHLCPFKVFAPSEPDMEGVKIVKGEWDKDEAAKRVIPIVGDCVAEYLRHGEGRKFIAFGCNVGHCEAMRAQFMAAGVNCALYTYHTSDSERDSIMAEFEKPDSYIRGLLSVSALAKGLDVPDVGVVIMARPLRKSLSEHIQCLGRGLRPYPGKDYCIILDHASNCMRFWSQMQDFFENGVNELDDGQKKEAKKPEKKERQPVRCPKCAHVHAPAPFCPACGTAYARRGDVRHEAGELRELGGATATRDEKQDLYSQLTYVQQQRGYKPGWVAYTYRDRVGVFPPSDLEALPKEPSQKLLNWLRSQAIRKAKARKKAGR